MRQRILYCLLAFLGCTLLTATLFSQQHGLSFYSYDVPKDERTSIVLPAEKEFSFKDEFELSFDLALHRTESFIYGYVFRIILDGDLNIDLIHGNRNEENRDFSIVEGKRKSDITFNIDPPLGNDNWINFRIKFLLNEDKIILYAKDNIYVDSSIDLKPRSRVSISFGACQIENFISTDVPPIMLRDIKLLGKGEKILYHWPLDQTRGDLAYDILKHEAASIANPNWLRNAHQNWHLVKDLNIKGFVQPVWNKKDEKVYLLGENFLIIYDAGTDQFDTLQYNEKPGFLVYDAQAVYDHKYDRIISININSRQLFYIDPASGEISGEDIKPYNRKEFLHHNKHYNESDSSLYIYNGYGHYLYKDSMFRCHAGTGIWKKIEVSGEQPQPRYLAASGLLNDTLYFLGGYGSESGKQMLSPQHYYDLYSFSLKDQRFTKLDSFPSPEEDFCLANSMVIDPVTRDYYALAFPEFKYNSNLQIVRGSLDNKSQTFGSLERLGSKIPYEFNDVNSFADLYFSMSSEQLLALTMITLDNETSIALYSIGFPPITEEPESAIKSESEANNHLLKILVFILILIIAWLIFRLSKRLKLEKDSLRENLQEDEITGIQDSSNKANAINFFGGFQVIDRNGSDLTSKFTPLLKELFLVIILHSIKNEKGISASRIIEILWFDKSERNAKNNLSVNITKLKNILGNLDGVELTIDTGYWKIHQDKRMYNEYCEVEAILKKDDLSPMMITRLIEITNKGPFLINLNFEWLDVFKAKISDRITDAILDYAKSLDISKNAELIIDLADCLFNFDIVNEEIMVLKCRAQYSHGKHSLAKKTYENFCNEYKILYGEDFGRSFNEIINNKADSLGN